MPLPGTATTNPASVFVETLAKSLGSWLTVDANRVEARKQGKLVMEVEAMPKMPRPIAEPQ